MKMPTQAQINAGLRYAGTAAGTVGSVFVLLGMVDADTSAKLVAAFHKFFDDVQAVVGDLYVIAGLAGPIVIAWLGYLGVRSASPKSQIASVQALPQAQVTVTDPKLAEGIPGVQVQKQ